MWAEQRICLAAAKRAGIEQLIYTSTVATIAVDRPELPNESTEAKLEEMIGHYKRSKWMAEQEVLREAQEKDCRCHCGDADDTGGAMGLEAYADGKIILDFLNGKMPGYVETGLNFVGVEECAAGHLLVSERGKLESDICWGRRISRLKGLLDVLARDYGFAGTMR